MAAGPPPTKVPSIAGYVLAVLLAIIGIAAGIALIVSGIRTYIDNVEGFERVEVPGSEPITLDDDGGYSIYFEDPSGAYQVVRPTVTVRAADGGDAVPLAAYESDVSYDVSGHEGRGIYTFSVDESGTYTVTGDGPRGTLAVGRGIGARFAGAVVAGVATLLLAPVLGAVLALVTFLRRSKAKRAAAATSAWGGPTGWR